MDSLGPTSPRYAPNSLEGVFLLTCAVKLLKGKTLQSGEINQLKGAPLDKVVSDLQKQLNPEEWKTAQKAMEKGLRALNEIRVLRAQNQLSKELSVKYYNPDGAIKETVLQEIAQSATRALQGDAKQPLSSPEVFLAKIAPGRLLLYITQDDPQRAGESEFDYYQRLDASDVIRNSMANKTGLRCQRPMAGAYHKQVIASARKELALKDFFSKIDKNRTLFPSDIKRLLAFCDNEQRKYDVR